MDNTLKQKWIERLKTNIKPQDTDVFREKNSFCALGVLMDVINPNGWFIDATGTYGHDLLKEINASNVQTRSIGGLNFHQMHLVVQAYEISLFEAIKVIKEL